eukprot:664458-Rhodomonas_salina.5
MVQVEELLQQEKRGQAGPLLRQAEVIFKATFPAEEQGPDKPAQLKFVSAIASIKAGMQRNSALRLTLSAMGLAGDGDGDADKAKAAREEARVRSMNPRQRLWEELQRIHELDLALELKYCTEGDEALLKAEEALRRGDLNHAEVLLLQAADKYQGALLPDLEQEQREAAMDGVRDGQRLWMMMTDHTPSH